MPCHHCADLCATYQARTPGELRKAVGIVAANVADGTLRELAPDPLLQGGNGSFAQVAAGSAWPDVFDFGFECTRCGARFSLQAETYHGAGGTWQPAHGTRNGH
jgi:hypothetical protein